MEKILDLISKEVSDAFEAAGYDKALGKCGVSNRPDKAYLEHVFCP